MVHPAGEVIDGFLTPGNLRYHPGHSWLERERPNRVRVGIDEFAATLVGRVDSVELPKPGQWIRQGQRVFAFLHNGERAEIVSPIEGEVVEVNTQVAANPAVLSQDPYGKGWLLAVHVPDEEGTLRNLVPVNLVASWMREAVERLYSLQPRLAGATAADGGRPVDDLWEGLPAESWKATVSTFFLTA
jgi:glycine cleavage system H protein